MGQRQRLREARRRRQERERHPPRKKKIWKKMYVLQISLSHTHTHTHTTHSVLNGIYTAYIYTYIPAKTLIGSKQQADCVHVLYRVSNAHKVQPSIPHRLLPHTLSPAIYKRSPSLSLTLRVFLSRCALSDCLFRCVSHTCVLCRLKWSLQ